MTRRPESNFWKDKQFSQVTRVVIVSDSVFVSSIFLLSELKMPSSTKNNPVFGAEVIPNHGKENGSNDLPDTRCSIEEGSTRDSLRVDAVGEPEYAEVTPNIPMEVNPGHGPVNTQHTVGYMDIIPPHASVSTPHNPMEDSRAYTLMSKQHPAVYMHLIPPQNIPVADNRAFGSSGTPHIPMEDNPAYGSTSTPHIPMADNPAYGSTSTPHIPIYDNPAHGSTSIPHIPMEDNPAYGSI